MLHEYHVIYSVWYYPRFHITMVGLGTYYPWIRLQPSIIQNNSNYPITTSGTTTCSESHTLHLTTKHFNLGRGIYNWVTWGESGICYIMLLLLLCDVVTVRAMLHMLLLLLCDVVTVRAMLHHVTVTALWCGHSQGYVTSCYCYCFVMWSVTHPNISNGHKLSVHARNIILLNSVHLLCFYMAHPAKSHSKFCISPTSTVPQKRGKILHHKFSAVPK
jgi:hypothetical protein